MKNYKSKIVKRRESSQKVKYYVHDNDVMVRKMIEASNWDVIKILYMGHSIKSIKKNLEKLDKRGNKILQFWMMKNLEKLDILARTCKHR